MGSLAAILKERPGFPPFAIFEGWGETRNLAAKDAPAFQFPEEGNSIPIPFGAGSNRVASQPAGGRRTASIYLAGVRGSKLIPHAPQPMDPAVERECAYLLNGIHVHGDESVGVVVGDDLL